ncbi:MAG: glycosyltransferase [Gemmatimonadales bacterium]|nr:glycosyltransferase [Gemmatimonadales bacterium]
MKVLHVVGGYPTLEKPSHQVFIKTQIDSLVKAGVDCEVLLLKGRGPRKYFFGRPQIRARLLAENYDLIHAHYTYCAFIALGMGLPLVTSFLGSDLYGYPRKDGSFPWLSRAAHIRLSRFVIRRSSVGIVKSEKMMTDLGLPLQIVPNGVDFDRFKPLSKFDRSRLRKDLGLAEGTSYVLFAGNPDLPRKRFDLAEAAVTIAGLSVEFPLKLLVLKNQPHELVVQHMQACDMLILTSSLEGSPNVVKEAMACDLPVVAVEVGDTLDRLTGVPGCRVTADESPSAIGRLVAEVLVSKEICGGREAVGPLEMDLVAGRIKEIYESVLS